MSNPKDALHPQKDAVPYEVTNGCGHITKSAGYLQRGELTFVPPPGQPKCWDCSFLPRQSAKSTSSKSERRRRHTLHPPKTATSYRRFQSVLHNAIPPTSNQPHGNARSSATVSLLTLVTS